MMTTLNNLYHICSYCLSESDLINIFEKKCNDIIYLTTKCLKIDINVNDEFPKFICENCFEALNSCVAFQKRSIWSINYLKELSTKLKQENDEVVFYSQVEEEVVNQQQSMQPCILEPNFITDSETYDINNKVSTVCPYCDKYFENLNKHISRDHFDVNIDDDVLEHVITNYNEKSQLIETYKSEASFDDNEPFNLESNSKQSICANELSIEKKDFAIKVINQGVKEKEKFNSTKICHICGKHVKSMDSHMKIHVPDSYTCDLCQKTLTTRDGIKQHLQVHLNKREFRCSICPMGFNTRKPLEVHMISHTGEKNFQCTTCGKRYTQQSSLRTHIKCTHERVYNIQCRYCDKMFYIPERRKRHEIVSHIGRQYQCKFCPKILKSEMGYFQHMNRHSAVNPYVCEKCDGKFTRLKEYKTHCRQHLLNII